MVEPIDFVKSDQYDFYCAMDVSTYHFTSLRSLAIFEQFEGNRKAGRPR